MFCFCLNDGGESVGSQLAIRSCLRTSTNHHLDGKLLMKHLFITYEQVCVNMLQIICTASAWSDVDITSSNLRRSDMYRAHRGVAISFAQGMTGQTWDHWPQHEARTITYGQCSYIEQAWHMPLCCDMRTKHLCGDLGRAGAKNRQHCFAGSINGHTWPHLPNLCPNCYKYEMVCENSRHTSRACSMT